MFSNLLAFRPLTVHADSAEVHAAGAPPSTTATGNAGDGGGAAQGDGVREHEGATTQHAEEHIERGNERFLAYANRAALVVRRGIRYVAYSSDIGESFRPVANPMWVNASYAVAAAYIVGDVAYHGYKAHEAGRSTSRVARVVVETTVFQLLASLLLPSLIIHTAVEQSHKVFRNGPLKKWGPVVTGLSLIPAMPYMDEPLEHLSEYCFDKVWPVDDDDDDGGDDDEHGGSDGHGGKGKAAAAAPTGGDAQAPAAAGAPGKQKVE